MAKKAAKKSAPKKEKKIPDTKAVGRPLKFPELDALKEAIDGYFTVCDPHIEYRQTPVQLKNGNWVIEDVPYITQQRAYTITGLALALNTTRVTILDYENLAELDSEDLPLGLRCKDPQLLKEYSYTIKRAKARIEEFVERFLVGGKGHPAGPIFNLKNNFKQWEDKTVVENPAEAAYHAQVEELRAVVTGRLKDAKKKR